MLVARATLPSAVPGVVVEPHSRVHRAVSCTRLMRLAEVTGIQADFELGGLKFTAEHRTTFSISPWE